MNQNYQIQEGVDVMDFTRVHAWLTASYWVPGIARETVEREARNSALVIGAFAADGSQIGYSRVISDKSRMAYLADVVVEEAHRGRGVARAMVQYALGHPELAAVSTWTLATRDAHGVYAPLGFRPITDPQSMPERWMVRRRPKPAPPAMEREGSKCRIGASAETLTPVIRLACAEDLEAINAIYNHYVLHSTCTPGLASSRWDNCARWASNSAAGTMWSTWSCASVTRPRRRTQRRKAMIDLSALGSMD